jgi:2-polyprenyl-6-methoxyphenol hydroxylase-like FAD-dependent oxidoreductase
MSSHDEVPVLIVGAGPAGAAAAIALARNGIRPLVVERRPRPGALTRATAIFIRSMELLRSWGVERAVREGAPEIEWLGLTCETLAAAGGGETIPLGVPTRAQAAAVSPTSAACVSQDHLERVLHEHMLATGAVRIERGVEATAVDARPDGARVTLRDGDGTERTVHARYLVAADGANGSLRRLLGIGAHGRENFANRIAAQFRAPLWDALGDRRYVLYPITRPGSEGTFIPAGRGDRWGYAYDWDPARERLADHTDERLVARIRAAAGMPSLPVRIEHAGPVTFGTRVAERFRRESAFLAGDAAHRMTPRGGAGMNTALQSGHDIGWKLAWVLRGWASPALLDSYEAERRPIAEHNVARSLADDVTTPPGTELHADLGGRIRHVWTGAGTGRASTLDLLGPGLTVFTGPDANGWQETVADASHGGAPIAVRRLDRIAAAALGVRGAAGLLTRPDGAPLALWPRPPASVAALSGALA